MVIRISENAGLTYNFPTYDFSRGECHTQQPPCDGPGFILIYIFVKNCGTLSGKKQGTLNWFFSHLIESLFLRGTMYHNMNMVAYL